MNKTFYLFSAFILVIILLTTASHAGEKRYLPIEERLRTLSLPPRTWKLDIGIEYDIISQITDNVNIGFSDNLMNFQLPHLVIGRKTELHFLYPLYKFYLVKNTLVQGSSSLMCNGPNFALLGGMTGLWYSERDKFDVSYGIGYQFKSLFGDRSWLFSHALGSLITNGDWHIRSATGIGFQHTQNLSTTLSFSAVAHKFVASYSLDQDPPLVFRTGDCINYTIKTPVDFRINMTRNFGILFRTGYLFTAYTSYKEDFQGVLVGVQFSWHW